MALTSGTRLGPYEILSPLGAGGTGEVYRARDARLGWEVAIKVLPERLATERDLVRRFEQPACDCPGGDANVKGLADTRGHFFGRCVTERRAFSRLTSSWRESS